MSEKIVQLNEEVIKGQIKECTCNKIVGKGGWQSNQAEKCVVQKEKIERISTPAHAAVRCQS